MCDRGMTLWEGGLYDRARRLDRARLQLMAEFPEHGFHFAGFQEDLLVLDRVISQLGQESLQIGDLFAERRRKEFFFGAGHDAAG